LNFNQNKIESSKQLAVYSKKKQSFKVLQDEVSLPALKIKND
jgi:hypothetical protein